MKSSAQFAYEGASSRIQNAPGMIEEVERRLLFKAAYNCPNLPIVEFGAFFGASTLALAKGLEARTEKANSKIYCIDAFEVSKDHAFHKHVVHYAKSFGIEHLLINESGRTDWTAITKAVLGDQLSRINLHKLVVDDKTSLAFLPSTIGLLHLDMPKDYKTIRPILRSAFPKLATGSIIAFQDYSYQFSNELIAYFEKLEQLRLINVAGIAASSIFYRVSCDNPSSVPWEKIIEDSAAEQTSLIQDAILKYKNYEGARGQELIALSGAAIRSLISKESLATFDQQSSVRALIKNMHEIDPARTAFVLAELLTEKLDTEV